MTTRLFLWRPDVADSNGSSEVRDYFEKSSNSDSLGYGSESVGSGFARGGGYALVNTGHELQDWLGRRSIQHTVRYTELSPTWFKDYWRE